MSTINGGRVVVLGTDPFIINACHARGLTAVVVRDVRAHLRGDNELPAGAQEAVVADISDVGEVMGGLLRLGGGAMPAGIVGVATTNEFAIAVQSYLCTKLGLIGPAMETVVLMRDKLAQKGAVQLAGVPTARARFCVAGSEDRMPSFLGPCIVKPISGAGAQETYKCNTEDEYERLLMRLAPQLGTPLVVEDLIDVEEEWLVDGVMREGQMVFSSLGRYGAPAIDYVGQSSASGEVKALQVYRMDAHTDPDTAQTTRTVSEASLKALGYDDGVFHLELLRERGSGRFLFGEVAARRGGGMIQEEVQFTRGFSLAGAAVDVAVGRQLEEPTQAESRHVATTWLYLSPGTIVSVADPDELMHLDYVHAVHVSALVGPNELPSTMSTSFRHGMCLVSGKTAEELERNLHEVRHRFREISRVAPTHRTKAHVRAFMAAQKRNSGG